MQEGVVFRCNVEVGLDIHIDELRQEYDAIVLAGGSSVPRDLPIPGRELKGIHFAMDFLTQQNKRNAGSQFIEENILAMDKRVIIIGGGDTGSDCVGTSNRQGATSVVQFELMPMPPESRTSMMPWPTYPMLLKTSTSHEEGVARKWAIATKAFIGNADGQLTALKVVDVEWKTQSDGKLAHYEEIQDSEREIPCNLALLALGFLSPKREGLIESLELALDDRGNVYTSGNTYHTDIPGIFSAGDMRRGQSLVVWAINEGRECAEKVDAYLIEKVLQEETNITLYKSRTL